MIISFDMETIQKKTKSLIERLKVEFSRLRIGTANPAILDSITIPYEGRNTVLKDVAQIIIKDPKTLLVNILNEVDKAIRNANLNLNPIIETNNSIKVPIPKITTEYREDITKVASKIAENSKIKLRLIRQDGMKDLKKDSKKNISSDQIKLLEKSLQLFVDKSVKEIDDVLKAKTKEISGN
ncbi:24539_t:CDS:2 [Entrophospora sp. SA101]|nr:7003_t:CDS:2 [Entrophospora sp. SA101]CAJ0749994.1 24539_t:CDS:2 [Entrophospora sp. SA101]CAJ0843404.1 3072_t:CDS:2 [Entrophospora sp. SA101]CAJ0900522.1 16592_t:CDS:2 [Entrophospora sp. SA101]